MHKFLLFRMTLHLEQIVVSEEGQSGFREGQSFLAEIANKWNHQVFRKHYRIAIAANFLTLYIRHFVCFFSEMFGKYNCSFVGGKLGWWMEAESVIGTRFIRWQPGQLLLGNQFSNFYWATNFPTFIAPLPIFFCHRGFSSRNEKEKLNEEMGIPCWSTYRHQASLYEFRYRVVDCGGQRCLQKGSE